LVRVEVGAARVELLVEVVRAGLRKVFRVVLRFWLIRVGARVERVGARWFDRIGTERIDVWLRDIERGAEIREGDLTVLGLEMLDRDIDLAGDGRDTDREAARGAERAADRTGAARDVVVRPPPVRTLWALARSDRHRARIAAQAVDRSLMDITACSWVS
jgi:hypothetical protein